MGYYATGEGYVKLKKRKDYEKVAEKLRPYYEIHHYDLTRVYFGIYNKYYEDEVEAALNAVLPYISEGEVEYVGKDELHWRFIWRSILKNGEWVKQNGHVVYDDE